MLVPKEPLLVGLIRSQPLMHSAMQRELVVYIDGLLQVIRDYQEKADALLRYGREKPEAMMAVLTELMNDALRRKGLKDGHQE